MEHFPENGRMWKLPMAIGVNLLLGIPAIVPLFLAWHIMVTGPLASLGWTRQYPNEDDGILPWLVIAVPVFCVFGLLWGLANLWLRRRTAVPAARYWTLCVAACLLPFGVLIIRSY
jgi:hypothetical protein